MPSRTLRMRSSIPYHLEHRLVEKWGYAVQRRVYVGENFIVFKKDYISDKSDAGLKRTIRASVNDNPLPASSTTQTKVVWPDFKNQLTTHQKKTLEKRCDNIVNFFPDPYSVPESVRTRLMVMMQKLTTVEAQFVLEYMNENFPVVDKGT